jgi:hypothetical protein
VEKTMKKRLAMVSLAIKVDVADCIWALGHMMWILHLLGRL